VTKEDARKAQEGFVSYVSSKKEAERAVWDFVETQKPHFGVTVLLPALIFGPPIQPVKSVLALNFSTGLFYSLWNGSYETVPATMFPSYIDARDLAAQHVAALTAPKAKNKRLLVGGAALTFTAIVRTIADLVKKGELPAEAASKLPKEGDADKDTPVPKIEAQEGNEALGVALTPFEVTVRDTAQKILELSYRES